MIKLFRGTVIFTLILILLALIHFKWQELEVNKSEIEILEQQKIVLKATLSELKERAETLSVNQEIISSQLDRWDDIDTRWLVWIEENWTLVKNINPHD